MAAAGATDLVIRNHEKHKELAKLVESLVTSGKPVLDKDILKTIKKDCRLYDECIRTVFKTVVVFMDEMHAQIRLGCLRLVEYLYFRSVLFREMMTTDFQTVVRCCIGLDDANDPLPPPKKFAKELRTEALRFVDKAHKKFGSAYKQLDLAHNFLLRVYKADFTRVQEASRAEQLAEDHRRRRLAARHAEKLTLVKAQLAEHRADFASTCTQLLNCARLLVPDISTLVPDTTQLLTSDTTEQERLSDPADALAALGNLDRDAERDKTLPQHDTEKDKETSSEDANDANFRALGLPAHELELTISVRKDQRVSVPQSRDNTALVHTVREQLQLVNTRYLPMCKKWIGTLQGCTASGSDAVLIDVLSTLEQLKNARDSCEKLDMGPSPPTNARQRADQRIRSPVCGVSAAVSTSDVSTGTENVVASASSASSDEDEELEDVPDFAPTNAFAHGNDCAERPIDTPSNTSANGTSAFAPSLDADWWHTSLPSPAPTAATAAGTATVPETSNGSMASAAGNSHRGRTKRKKKQESALVDLKAANNTARRRLMKKLRRPPSGFLKQRK
eukprot:m.618222 g.618222  ORF g.618222 m.618222 type:complete len:562 (-) comp22527_c1_seq9:66-1751(-)